MVEGGCWEVKTWKVDSLGVEEEALRDGKCNVLAGKRTVEGKADS